MQPRSAAARLSRPRKQKTPLDRAHERVHLVSQAVKHETPANWELGVDHARLLVLESISLYEWVVRQAMAERHAPPLSLVEYAQTHKKGPCLED